MRIIFLTLVTVLILSACGPVQTVVPTATNTLEPSETATVEPTSTNTLAPTNTLQPTKAPMPTRTPRPYEEFFSYTNKFIELFNQVTKLRDETDELKLNEVYFEKVDGKTTLFISLNNIPSRITDGSVLALPVTIMDDIRDNKKAKIPGDINRIVITSLNMDSVKKLTINIKWSDLREFIDGNITFNQFFSLVEQIRN